MKNLSFDEKTNEIGKIALWGPSGSGKSWLLHAFSKTLLKYSMHDKDFLYELTDENRRPFDSLLSPEKLQATEIIQDHVFRFRRIGKRDTFAHQISSNEHTINIVDNKGTDLISLDDTATTESVLASPNIILMLDVSQSRLTRSVNPPSIAEEYAGLVDRLLQLLTKTQGQQRYIAVCLSKSDLFSVRKRETTSLIKMLFGNDMFDVFTRYDTGKNLKFEYFTTSSVGFLPNGQSNYNMENGYLVDETRWEPFNVEFPFFWFFENIERSRISQSHRNFFTRLLVKDRLSSYIPYPRPSI